MAQGAALEISWAQLGTNWTNSPPKIAPDAFNVFLSITFLVGIVIGGLASISGAIFGALFIQFVPNWAQEISKAAPWAIYGIFLIVFMYVMPRGIAGSLRLAWTRLARVGGTGRTG